MTNDIHSFDVSSIAIVLFGIALVFFIRNWIKDCLFYKRNGWDFTKPSGDKMFFGGDGYFGNEMSNKTRVVFGYPFLIGGFVVVICGALLAKL